jgi:hypothetical protein
MHLPTGELNILSPVCRDIENCRNDKIIAAAPLSGYLSIPTYVPYHMWHEADPRKTAMVQASLNTYKHELLIANMRGTPIFQQHGRDDDNVPVYHSRRMHQLVGEEDWWTDYFEIPGKGHWWDGVMTEGALSGFLTHFLDEQPSIPELPFSFSVVVANPGDTGPRGGIVVDQLEEPDRYAVVWSPSMHHHCLLSKTTDWDVLMSKGTVTGGIYPHPTSGDGILQSLAPDVSKHHSV